MDVLLYVLGGLVVLLLLSLTPPGTAFRRRTMAKLYTSTQKKYEPHVAERKKRLFADLSGTVLEIGPGNGCNFAYLPDTVHRWIGIEPNPYMHTELRGAGAARGIEADFRTVSAEGMDVDDDSVDAVLSTLVLCSVPDPDTAIRDIHRILKPGGRFVFIEHVAAPRGSGLRRLQRLVKPLWWWFADGCRPDRELGDAIRRGGFSSVEIEEFRLDRKAVPAVVAPQIAGVAVK